jgi:hypothetical protein
MLPDDGMTYRRSGNANGRQRQAWDESPRWFRHGLKLLTSIIPTFSYKLPCFCGRKPAEASGTEASWSLRSSEVEATVRKPPEVESWPAQLLGLPALDVLGDP